MRNAEHGGTTLHRVPKDDLKCTIYYDSKGDVKIKRYDQDCKILETKEGVVIK